MADTQKTKISPLAAGIAGGIAGAVGAATAIALSNKQNREKIAKSASNIKQWGDKTMKAWRENAEKAADTAEKTAEDILSEDDKDTSRHTSKSV